jgi:hypothetical protein
VLTIIRVTFTKLFSSITESTIWCEDDRTRIVWITMLAMANKNGFVFGSAPGLANRARVPVQAVRVALAKFQQPDPDSRTKDFEGRRIAEIDGGWKLLTYDKHRSIRDEEERKEYMKNLMRQKRAAVSNVSHRKPLLAQAEADTEAEAVSQNLRASARFSKSKIDLTHLANPNCTVCVGSGYRRSYSNPKKEEPCECAAPDASWKSE